MSQAYALVLDEVWTFLDARGNPVNGRKLTFRLEDGTIIEIDVTKEEYRDADAIRGLLSAEIEAHEAVVGI